MKMRDFAVFFNQIPFVAQIWIWQISLLARSLQIRLFPPNFKIENRFTRVTIVHEISLSFNPKPVIWSNFRTFHSRQRYVTWRSVTALCIIISSISSNSGRCSLCWFSGESGRSTKASGLIHFLPPSPLSRLIRRQRCRQYFVTGPVFEALVFCRRLSNTIEPQEAEGEFKGAAKGGMFLYLRLY